MKVAVVTQYFPTSAQQWAGHSAYQTLKLLSRRFDVQVFYPEAVYPSFLRPASAQRAALDRNWHPPDVKAAYIPYAALPVISRPANGFTMTRRLLPFVREFQPDVIFNYTVYPDGLAAVRIAGSLKVPCVLTAIGSDLNRVTDPLRGMLTRYTLGHADFVTTVSGDLAKTAVRLGANPAATQAILNGCDTSVFRPMEKAQARAVLKVNPDREVIVYVGRLDVRKGLVELIEAVNALRPARPRLHTYIVGDGPDRPVLEKAIAKHNEARSEEGEWITLVPSCPTSVVSQWMAAADLVTLPSYKEGCPNVVIEALASGRPVVATNVGGIPELMGEDVGQLVPARDAAALRNALDAVLSREWDAEWIASRHSRSWNDVAEDVAAVLERALDGRQLV